MFDVVGREVLYGPRRPLGTAAYRAELKSLTGHAGIPRGSSYRVHHPGNLVRGKEPYFSHWRMKEFGMSACPTARNGAENVRKVPRALYYKPKQDKDTTFYSLYDKVWRTDVLWEP